MKRSPGSLQPPLPAMWIARRRGGMRDSPMEVAIEKNPAAVKSWLRAQPAGDARDTAVVQTLRAMREPQEMIPLLSMLPPDATPEAAKVIAGKFQGSFDAAKQWAGNLPAGPTRTAAWTALGEQRGLAIVPELPRGPDRDAMLRGMAQAPLSSVRSPERPMEYVLKIDDPALRRQTFDNVMNGWIANPKRRESAGPWLDGAPVPEEWKAKWRERQPGGRRADACAVHRAQGPHRCRPRRTTGRSGAGGTARPALCLCHRGWRDDAGSRQCGDG